MKKLIYLNILLILVFAGCKTTTQVQKTQVFVKWINITGNAVNPSCAQDNTGDYSFENYLKMKLFVTINDNIQLIVMPGLMESKFNMPAGIHKYYITNIDNKITYTDAEKKEMLIYETQGDLIVEKCKRKTMTIGVKK